MQRPLALVVDKDPAVRALIRDVFEDHDVTVMGAGSPSEADGLLKTRAVDILLLGGDTPGLDLRGTIQRGLASEHAPVVVVVSPDGGLDKRATAEAIDAGAFDVVGKPLVEPGLQALVKRVCRQQTVLADLRRIRGELQSREGFNGLVGRTDPMERIREQLRRLARSVVPVCFAGERGAGKERAARTLLEWSGGAERSFVVIECPRLADADWDTRWRGSETVPAVADEARGGCVFLESVTELSLPLQERLSHQLAENDPDFRVFSSLIGDPRVAVEEGRLLQDLHDKIAVETVALPPLRERRDDIPLLARHFLSVIREINNLSPLRIAPETMALLERYRWPGNVLELRTAMEQAVILSPDGVIRPEHIPDRIREFAAGEPAAAGSGTAPQAGRRFRAAKREVVESFERRYLTELMVRHGGNVTAASQQAGMLRSALQRLLRKYDLKSAEFRKRRTSAAVGEPSRSRGD